MSMSFSIPIFFVLCFCGLGILRGLGSFGGVVIVCVLGHFIILFCVLILLYVLVHVHVLFHPNFFVLCFCGLGILRGLGVLDLINLVFHVFVFKFIVHFIQNFLFLFLLLVTVLVYVLVYLLGCLGGVISIILYILFFI